ncbi:hypothetical protein K458DRAFT_6380 [Lentithecium fluviatile CBS 122367]|uniref:Protein kinase domain-containing protein n=1 Tax=Lentithecium fluviatile CBS 122367 TaxID=1168545 RepID=A0A6G1JN46_9PLEO|nr:hypothetical protein K458DRAFT_6380 [Lentithecium fluviatile CBS 122367]
MNDLAGRSVVASPAVRVSSVAVLGYDPLAFREFEQPESSNDINVLTKTLSRLQIVDDSSSSKPDNYRTSPITPQATLDPRPTADVKKANHGLERKMEVDLIREDWSGKGVHVDFQPSEQVPLKEGRFLGQGSVGVVYETIIRGHAFAWKRRFCRHRIGDAESKEIEILKKVSHHHIVKFAGSLRIGNF